MIRKKGQITLILIIIIVILLIFGILIYSAVKIRVPALELSAEDKTLVNSFFQNCLAEVSEDALFILGQQGGSIYLSEPYFYGFNSPIDYLYLNGTKRSLSTSFVERELSKYVTENIGSCVERFPLSGFNLKIVGTPECKVSLNKKDVYFGLEYPLKIRKGEAGGKLDKIGTSVNIRLLDAINLADSIIEEQIRKGWVRASIVLDSGFDSTYFSYSDSLIVVLEDALPNFKPYTFMFAEKGI